MMCMDMNIDNDHLQIVDAYSSGVEAYKDIKQKYGLTTDRIDDVMDTVQEVSTNIILIRSLPLT